MNVPLKARVMNAFMGMGLSGLALAWWKMLGKPTGHLKAKSLQERFSRIYRDGHWGTEESRSGRGSTLESTESIRLKLPELLNGLEARSLLDVGCGDFNWMQHVPLECPYIGVDVVPEVIAENMRRYGNENRRFHAVDATREDLPHADVVLCRDVTFHLSFKDMEGLLTRIRKSGARYLIATTEDSVRYNIDFPSGDFRERNLALKPFNLGQPIDSLWDGRVSGNRQLGVWKL